MPVTMTKTETFLESDESSEDSYKPTSRGNGGCSSSCDHNLSSGYKRNPDDKVTLTHEARPMTPRTESRPDTYINLRDVSPGFETRPPKTGWASRSRHNSARDQSFTSPQRAPAAFRAIIVGGGPNGLCLAHALHLAGLDYVILERSSEIVTSGGATLALWPHSVRILDQLGLLDEARKHYLPIKTKHNHRADGSVIDVNDMFAKMEENFGHPWMLFHRAKLLELLWEALPGKETKAKVNKKVKTVFSNRDGVVVACEDGTFETGSVVVGCDGVHSTVRQAIHDLRSAKQRSAGRLGLGGLGGLGSDSGEDKPSKTYYHGLIGWIPMPDGLQPGACYEVRSEPKGKTFHIFTGEDTAYFLVYVRLARPTRERRRYTDGDAEELAAALAGHKITPGLRFGDLWRSRRWGKMLDYQEGLLGGRWYHERVVLVGDAVHKLTPSAGLGLNAGWQGVAELANRLRRLVAAEGQAPDTRSVEKVFRRYQGRRRGMARTALLLSGLYTRVVANQNPLYRFCDRVTPAVGGDVALLNKLASPIIIKRGVTLDYVAERGYKEGKVRWAHPRQVPAEDRAGEEGNTAWKEISRRVSLFLGTF